MFFLCWRLQWIPQFREVLERRLRVLSCVCQTSEMLPENFSISFELDLKELTGGGNESEFTDESLGGKRRYTNNGDLTSISVDSENKFLLKGVGKKELYDKYLVLEAQLELINAGDYKNGPPVNVKDIYEESMSHRLYDTAFVVQR